MPDAPAMSDAPLHPIHASGTLDRVIQSIDHASISQQMIDRSLQRDGPTTHAHSAWIALLSALFCTAELNALDAPGIVWDLTASGDVDALTLTIRRVPRSPNTPVSPSDGGEQWIRDAA